MEVTNENFESILPDLMKQYEDCDFCSFDCELSGITNMKMLNAFDSPRIRYEKIRKNDEKYLILQFGMCLFKRKDNLDRPNCYECNAYNCFLFPRSQNSKYSKDTTFACLNSSIEFLCEQNFDFNKVFNRGISFMSKDIEEITRHKLMETLEERKKPKSTLYPTSKQMEKEKNIKQQIDMIMIEIENFSKDKEQTVKEIKFSEFLIRIFVEKNIKLKYSQMLKYESKILENKERIMRLIKIDANNQVSELDILEKEIGFSKLIWHIAKSNKLIVGHNLLTDLMQIMRQFFSSQLPENFDDFKSMTNSLFPKILDTKYMASVAPLKELISNTALAEMEKILSKDTFPKIHIENSQYSTENEKLHEAGYDAYLTGCCYLKMLHYLESFNSSKNSLIEFYSNKIFLMKNYDICHIDIKNNQEEPKRENVFYVEFPCYWETQDIMDLFNPYGSVYVGWIDDKSSFVALQNLENVKKAASHLVGVTGRDYKVYFYQTFINQLSKVKVKTTARPQSEITKNIVEPNGNGNNDKRKRGSPTPENLPKIDDFYEISTNDKTEEHQNDIKKIKNIESIHEKPFDQCNDWSV